MPGQSRPVFLFGRLLPRPRRNAGTVSAAPPPAIRHTGLAKARWPLSAGHSLSEQFALQSFVVRLGTRLTLMLWTRQAPLAFRAKDIAVKVRDPLATAGSD